MQQKTKTLLLRALLLAGILLLLDQACGRLLEHYYRKVKSGSEYKTVYALEESREPLIIMGSSRAYHHYIPALLQEGLGKACYNLGRDGVGVLYDYAVYRTICDRKAPGIMIVDINPEEFIEQEVTYQLLFQLLPHYDENDYIKEVVNLRSRSEWLKAQSRLYRFNSQLFYIAVNNMRSTGMDTTKGYLPLQGKLDQAPEQGRAGQPIDERLVVYFEKLLKETRRQHTRVAVCISPVYRRYVKGTASIRYAAALCRRYGIPFLDFSQDKRFLDHPELFRDVSHLNDSGAHLYTSLLVQALKDLNY